MKKRIVTIVGARPQFIKVLPLVRRLKKIFDSKVVHTGQHYDYQMSRIFFKELDISKPDCNLNIGSGTHGAQTARMLERIEGVLRKYDPTLVIVVGDTNSTLAGALAATKLNIPMVHIEAGLRSFNRSMPEEINRVVSDHVSSILFCPTKNAIRNLKAEGIAKGVYLTGDVMYDAMKMILPISRKKRKIIDELGVEKKKYFLLTIHRDFNTDNRAGLKSLINKLNKLGSKIVFPVHPRTKQTLKSYGLWETLKNSKNIIVIKPVGYIDFLTLQIHAAMIITDSGGVQKEAYLLKVPCLTLRDETEWAETLKGNANRLVGKYGVHLKVPLNVSRLKCHWQKDVYGTGIASKKIVKVLEQFLKRCN